MSRLKKDGCKIIYLPSKRAFDGFRKFPHRIFSVNVTSSRLGRSAQEQ
jgi:hypothetical protein